MSDSQTVVVDKSGHKVQQMFAEIAPKYDLMNHVLSLNVDRWWRWRTVRRLAPKADARVLDVCTGTGDLALALLHRMNKDGMNKDGRQVAQAAAGNGHPSAASTEKTAAGRQGILTSEQASARDLGDCRVVASDFCRPMLEIGEKKASRLPGHALQFVEADSLRLPFPSEQFDLVTVAFGLRNMTHRDVALKEMTRVLKPGGKLCVLEFSRVNKALAPAYDWYSFNVLPWLGKKVANDADSYRYLAESIRMHPDQETLKTMMAQAGLARVAYYNLTAGVVALHEGVKLG
jgi:demethylmenaquinone methyltransferase/2-methoxy-6-polyprenyl-1,4-benzoquinol methylase